MVELTLFEVHLDGAEFTANAPFSSADAEEADDADWEVLGGDEGGESEDAGGGPNPGKAVFAVVLAVVLAVVIKKVLGGGGDAE